MGFEIRKQKNFKNADKSRRRVRKIQEETKLTLRKA